MIKWPSPAKLNLFLYITGRRQDGYHYLQTLFQFLDYGDTVSIVSNQRGTLQLITPVADIKEENNLIIRAANLLRIQAEIHGTLSTKVGATFSIEKRIPIGGGLGGGSSNAATVLIALNYLWNTRFSLKHLSLLALQLGADVPAFIWGLTSFADGIGDRLIPLLLDEKWYLIIYPRISISSFQVFSDFHLTRDTPRRHIKDLLLHPFHNDCERIVRKRCNEVETVISWLSRYASPHMTGTGSCIFAEFNTKKAALNILNRIPEQWQGFVARGVNTSPLHTFFSRIVN
ncbi:4-(cytidine 5'-diphospho)-2-C-methyl-D-erythritol kinase [Candidatus Erwinia haradaeae]|uniref:4-diphosphocytidyl-2-C-methyl-D-erythritol kinase n=1 Tax=Candidatus Erwinia haradaeae TaxID=1922217 RepID=A0A451D889_9GAMM|nr:4-(cytidine 5'-diphospho)-2-C-methyl-D-erythritol kinase [Candidatus Erwinia haradaeae]VFP82060.1 4-diphosphocytidyl-2-C-methyl-D-erythritol kinase [Candidatus Erwinia haradaeae]